MVEIDIPDAAIVGTDAGLLKLIMQNLLGNAIKYSDQGTIRITAKAQDPAAFWLLEISDQGNGIPADVLPTLFDAFTRGRADGQPGVGLGLFIAAQAAKTIGARITVESKLNEGSTFGVTLVKWDFTRWPSDPIGV